MKTPVRICIIGYKGYLGSFLYQELSQISLEFELTGYDTKNGKQDKGELVDVSNQDVVIYLAGLSGRASCANKPSTQTFHENVYDIMTVAHSMRPSALLIYASTASLYEGYGATMPEETAYLNVQLYDTYAYSMYLREQNVKTLTHVNTIGLRLGTVIGLSPNQRQDLVHFSLLRNAVLTGVARVFGANQNRAILWNRDLLQVMSNILNSLPNPEETRVNHKIYNLASFNCTVAKIANELAALTGCNTLFEGDDETVKYNIGFSMNTNAIQRDYGVVWKASSNRFVFEDLIRNLKQICSSPKTLQPCETLVCRVCKSNQMRVIYNFGNQPNANHYLTTPHAVLPEYPLQLCLCVDCWHTQIPYTIPPEQMFSNYVYLCGTSNTMRKYFSEFADKSIREYGNLETGNVLEIACNDGTLLDAYAARGWKTFGFDPARNLWEISSAKGHDVTVGFWGVDAIPAHYPEFDIVVAQNVCAHVPDPVAFLKKCRDVMSRHTLLYVQTSQCHMIEQGQFDTAYHEHMSFFTVHSMMTAAKLAGLVLDDVEKMDVHGTSYLFKLRLVSQNDITQHAAYVYEKEIGLYDELMYYVYVEKIKELVSWMQKTVKQYNMYPVVGYGAAAKGMTILNTIGHIPMQFIADDSKNKQGYYATNHGYLITSPEAMAKAGDVICLVVFAWNFLAEIMEKTRRIRQGKITYFVVPYPKHTIIHMNAVGHIHIVYENVDTRFNRESLHHSTILLSHFYNEELLLTQWIRHHASMFNCAVLINHHSTDASVEIIKREAPSTWNVVVSGSREFCANATDVEVSGYENSFDNSDWRLALTTTEFLFTTGLRRKSNPIFEDLYGTDAIKISSVSLIDHQPRELVNRSMSLLRQKNSYFFKLDNAPLTEDERYLNNHYNRFMHRVRNMGNPYWLGRHNFKYGAVSKHLFILKCLYTPYPEFYSRKLQIRGRMSEMNVREKWGFQHMMEMDEMVEKYNALKMKPNACITNISDQMMFFDMYMKSIPQWEKEQMLCGVYANLYDK